MSSLLQKTWAVALAGPHPSGDRQDVKGQALSRRRPLIPRQRERYGRRSCFSAAVSTTPAWTIGGNQLELFVRANPKRLETRRDNKSSYRKDINFFVATYRRIEWMFCLRKLLPAPVLFFSCCCFVFFSRGGGCQGLFLSTHILMPDSFHSKHSRRRGARIAGTFPPALQWNQSRGRRFLLR